MKKLNYKFGRHSASDHIHQISLSNKEEKQNYWSYPLEDIEIIIGDDNILELTANLRKWDSLGGHKFDGVDLSVYDMSKYNNIDEYTEWYKFGPFWNRQKSRIFKYSESFLRKERVPYHLKTSVKWNIYFLFI